MELILGIIGAIVLTALVVLFGIGEYKNIKWAIEQKKLGNKLSKKAYVNITVMTLALIFLIVSFLQMVL